MLDISEASLRIEVKDAEQLRKRHLDMSVEVIKHLAGRFYRSDARENKPTPENYPFAYVSFVRPQLVFDRPTVNVTPTNQVTDQGVADDLQGAINHWMKDVQFKPMLSSVVLDMLIGFGVTKVFLEAQGAQLGDHEGTGQSSAQSAGMAPGMPAQGFPSEFDDFELDPTKPGVKRIAPGDFLIDPYCDSSRTARWMGHSFERDLNDLQNDPRYLESKGEDGQPIVMGLGTNMPTKRDDDPFYNEGDRAQTRKRVKLVEMFFPEYKKLITLAYVSGGLGHIVRTVDYYGPKEGPYTLWGMYEIPGQVYPLSPLIATYEQFLELQDHATAAAEEAANYKLLGVVDANDPKLGSDIKEAKNGEIIIAKNPGGYTKVELGGTSKARIDYVQILRDRLDRAMGFADAQRGASAGVTATEASIADNNSDLRIEYMRQQVRDHCKDMLSKVAWYMFYEETVAQAMTKTDPHTGQQVQGVFAGGIFPGQEKMTIEDFGFDIDPMSMVKIDNAYLQKRFQDCMQILPALGQAMQMFPQFNWRQIMDWWGQSLNIPNFSKVIMMPPPPMMGGMPPGMMPPGMMPPGAPPMGGPGGPGGGPSPMQQPNVPIAPPPGAGPAGMRSNAGMLGQMGRIQSAA